MVHRIYYWNYRDNIAYVDIITRSSGKNNSEYYVYDSSGQRVRKVTETYQNNEAHSTKVEKIYFGDIEVIRTYKNHSLSKEKYTVHVMDDKSRVALHHYWTRGTPDETRNSQSRYQLSNHLDSVALELNDSAEIMTYEEYLPFGGTALIAGKTAREVTEKEYRYSGKERDESIGLYYYGARYYAPWLARWINPDPAGTVDGLNLYQFIGGNPVNSVDMVGFARTSSTVYIDRDFPEDNDPIQHLNARFVSFIGLGGTIQRIAQNIQERNGRDFRNSLVVGADEINGIGGGGAQFQDRTAKGILNQHAAHLTPGRINLHENLDANEYTELSGRLGHTEIQPQDVNWYTGRTIDRAQSDVLGKGLLANINFNQGVTPGNLHAVRAIRDIFVAYSRSQLNRYNVTNLEEAELSHEALQANHLDIFTDHLYKESIILRALQRGVEDFYSPLTTENRKEITHISVPKRIPMSLPNMISYACQQRKQKLIARIKEKGYHPYRSAFTYQQRKRELIARIKEQGYHPSYLEKVRILGIAG